MIARLRLQNVMWTVGLGALLFLPAGTLHWPAAWLYVATTAVLGLAGGLWLAKVDPALLEERMRPMMQKGQPAADKKFMLVFGFAALTSAFTAAFDLSQRNTQTALTYPSVSDTATAAVGQELSQTGAMITRRNLNVQPTIKVPAGYKFTVRVNRDILFDAPYQPVAANPLPMQSPGQLHRRTSFSTTGDAPVTAVLQEGDTYAVGIKMFSDYLLQFEIVGVFLLGAIIGAIVLAKTPKPIDAGRE